MDKFTKVKNPFFLHGIQVSNTSQKKSEMHTQNTIPKTSNVDNFEHFVQEHTYKKKSYKKILNQYSIL